MAEGPCMDDNDNHDDLPTKMMVLHGCAKEDPKKRPNC